MLFLKKKEVPVTLSFINVPEGFPVNQLDFTISNETIEVAGPESNIDQYREISLGQIDIRTLDLNSTYSFSVELPTGYVNTQNIQSVLVQFDSTGMVEKNFNVTNIVVENVPLNYEVEVTTEPSRSIPQGQLYAGASCIANGSYFYTSYGDEPHGTASGRRVLVSRIVDATRPACVHITDEAGNPLGWIDKSALQVVSDT